MKCKINPKWIRLELEHLNEFGCGYYPALLKMERRLK